MIRREDRAAVALTALVGVPVAAGLLWVAAGEDIALLVVTALCLIAWLVIAFPLAVLVGRWTARHTSGLPEEEVRDR